MKDAERARQEAEPQTVEEETKSFTRGEDSGPAAEFKAQEVQEAHELRVATEQTEHAHAPEPEPFCPTRCMVGDEADEGVSPTHVTPLMSTESSRDATHRSVDLNEPGVCEFVGDEWEEEEEEEEEEAAPTPSKNVTYDPHLLDTVLTKHGFQAALNVKVLG